MPLEATKHVNGRMWPPGVSGNPNGRPVGSRTAFSQGFLKDLAEVWAEHGKETMIKTAQDNPGVFFATCARLIGPEVKLTIEQSLPGNLSPGAAAARHPSSALARPFRRERGDYCCGSIVLLLLPRGSCLDVLLDDKDQGTRV